MKLIFNPCGEAWKAQLAKSTLLTSTLGAPWSFQIFKVCSDAKEKVGCRKQREASYLFIPSKTATLVPEFAVVDLPLAELQPRCLNLQWKTCPWAEHSMMIIMPIVKNGPLNCRTYLSLVKLQPWFLCLRWKTCIWVELQLLCLSLQWKTCSLAEHSEDYAEKCSMFCFKT